MAENPNRPLWRRYAPFILLIVAVMGGFGAGIWVGIRRQKASTPQVIRVIENPTSKEAQGNVVLKEEIRGHLKGDVRLPKQQREPKRDLGTPGNQRKTSGAGSGDFEATVPMQGEINTRYKVDGKVVGEGTHPVKGESVVKKKGDQLTVDTTFTDTVEVAVELKKPEPKLWRVGIYTAFDGDVSYGGYVQRNIPLLQTEKADLYGFVKAAVEKANETEAKVFVGLEVHF